MKHLSFIVFLIIISFSCNSEKYYDKLETKIEDGLKKAMLQFEKSNTGFIMNVVKNDTVIIQIVHSSFLAETKLQNDKFGFAINLMFDLDIPNEFQFHEKFKKIRYIERIY